MSSKVEGIRIQLPRNLLVTHLQMDGPSMLNSFKASIKVKKKLSEI